MTRMTVAALIAALALAGCGVDGPPRAPAGAGVTIEGDAQVGVVSGGQSGGQSGG
ncbi:MAG: hypothetical protein N2422_04130 [Rhodobacteraceae bacterium]|nr:hypothetical protein [Paracoccaceae bacterium]